MGNRYLFSSESVAQGHPDKVADQISDAVLDAILAQDKKGRVACETLVTTGLALVGGEITTDCYVEIPDIVREMLKNIGYTSSDMGIDYESCAILTAIGRQSRDIALGVDESTSKSHEQGAGDQGHMFGYACTETPELMPMPIMLAHKLMKEFARARSSGEVKFFRPDGKCQVTMEYDEENRPVRVDKVIFAAQHTEEAKEKDVKDACIEKIIKPVIGKELLKKTQFIVNGTGKFVIGGPQADTGVTGRKIIVDTYGGSCPHGGGAFSGKDPSKVDRSASYAVRHVAKNVVAAGLAERCQIQIAYCIGIAEPMSVNLTTFRTGKIADEKIRQLVLKHWDLRPRAIIDYFDLLRPIYRKTAAFGHFGRNEPEFTWERTEKAEALKEEAGL
jgi:S-adenosylmethionine synthetase